GARLVVLEIPLLFETGAERRCDYTALVSAPARVQRRRVLARPGMTLEKLGGMRVRQMPEAKKRARADFVIPSGQGRAATLRAVRAIVRMLENRRGRCRPNRRLGP
ncbi:MAG TPA: dephospho-CoA kinase, partial [Alphaproteobacteria bacterium]|nr:dephospho-CoA kinase [Alphaproteobacteria bacterium]